MSTKPIKTEHQKQLEDKDEIIRLLKEALRVVVNQRDKAMAATSWDTIEKAHQKRIMDDNIQKILRKHAQAEGH